MPGSWPGLRRGTDLRVANRPRGGHGTDPDAGLCEEIKVARNPLQAPARTESEPTN